jgi:hypothetical protein
VKEAGLDGRCSIGVLHPGFKSQERVVPGVGAARVGAGEKVGFILAVVIATGAAAIVPLIPIFHHSADTEKSTDVLGHP